MELITYLRTNIIKECIAEYGIVSILEGWVGLYKYLRHISKYTFFNIKMDNIYKLACLNKFMYFLNHTEDPIRTD
jgi:hypothetical protein